MAKLDTYLTLLERLQSTHLSVDAHACVAVRNRNAPCRRCAQACTSGCIGLADNDLTVDATRCIGCGTCATACPTGAIEARQPDDRELALAATSALRRNGGRAVFACEQVRDAARGLYDPESVTGVTCLGRVDESLLVALAAAGASSIRLVRGACAECAHARGADTAQAVCDSANALFEAWECNVRASISPRFPGFCRLAGKPAYDDARRAFLLSMGSEAQAVAEEAAGFAWDRTLGNQESRPRFPHVTDDGTLPRLMSRRRSLLLDGLEALGAPEEGLVATRLWGHVVVDAERCDGCSMCAVFCPTGALSKCSADGKVGLAHAPGLCVKCRCCEALCPHDALTLSDEVFAQDIHAGFVEFLPLRDIRQEKGGPDAIRNSMKKLIDSPYLWG